MDYKEIYESWLANPYFDEATKAELLSIKEDDKEIKECFYKDLEFGTAGLRGIIVYKPDEHLYRTKDDAGTGKLHKETE